MDTLIILDHIWSSLPGCSKRICGLRVAFLSGYYDPARIGLWAVRQCETFEDFEDNGTNFGMFGMCFHNRFGIWFQTPVESTINYFTSSDLPDISF